MPNSFEGSEHLVVNTLGHAAGVLIFGIFLVLALRNRVASRLRASRLAFLAATLALLWNLVSLATLLVGGTDTPAQRIIAGIGFSALSLLPAVLLNLCLVNRFPVLIRSGYGLSALATAAHLIELVRGAEIYHRTGLALITIGFGILTVVSVIKVLWSADDNPRLLSSRILAAMSLFLFAISFVHFSDLHSHRAWSTELAFHHAGIPLALFVLLQDYRFVLLDAFIRFLANGLLAALFALVIATSLSHLNFPAQVLVASLLLATFAVARSAVQRLLSRIVFRQSNPDKVIRELRVMATHATDEDSYVREATRRLAAFMNTSLIETPETAQLHLLDSVLPALVTELPRSRELQRDGVELIVPIRLAHGATRYSLLGERRGGRRYLSEDLDTLARLAACIAEQADQIREAEMRRLVSQAELRALQSQIHPHFLFNALNTLYGIIPRELASARRMLLNLAEIFRYFLHSDKTYIALEEELRIVKAYLSIEELRLGGKLRIAIDVAESALREQIPVLSIQPLVENAVKHGVAARAEGGEIQVEVKLEEGGLRVRVRDTGPGFSFPRPAISGEHTGIGLENVSRRLQLCYGPTARLDVQSSSEGTTVSFFASAHDGKTPQRPERDGAERGRGDHQPR